MDNAPTKGASALRSRAGDLWGVRERTDGSASGGRNRPFPRGGKRVKGHFSTHLLFGTRVATSTIWRHQTPNNRELRWVQGCKVQNTWQNGRCRPVWAVGRGHVDKSEHMEGGSIGRFFF